MGFIYESPDPDLVLNQIQTKIKRKFISNPKLAKSHPFGIEWDLLLRFFFNAVLFFSALLCFVWLFPHHSIPEQ